MTLAGVAALLAVAPAASAADLTELAAERSASHSLGAASAAPGKIRLPLPAPLHRPAVVARAKAQLAAEDGRARMLVGLDRHEDLADVAALLESLGSDVRPLTSIGALAFTADSASAAVARLSSDPRIAFVERNRRHQIAADPATDNVDPDTGIPYDWAFERVRAAQALAAVGGGSTRPIAVIDTGGDMGHPDLAQNLSGSRDVRTGRSSVRDTVGHGTFVAGGIGMVHDNGIGGKGVAGRTPIRVVKADHPYGGFATEDIVAAIEYSIRARARVINMSLGGDSLTETEARALDLAFFEDVLPVAAAGNAAQDGNPVHYPAALVGGEEGFPGIGLAVAATGPDDRWSNFSSHGYYVSVAAPGGELDGRCWHGPFSTTPRNLTEIWDDPRDECLRTFVDETGSWAYGAGTSFAAPIAAGISALAWEAEPRLQSEQVAEVIMRSARQTQGEPGTWNEFTGRGIVDGEAAVALARIYDIAEPTGMVARQKRSGRTKLRVTAVGAVDATEEGDELAGGVRHLLLRSINGREPTVVANEGPEGVKKTFRLRRGSRYRFIAGACDANGNCAIQRLKAIKGR